MTLLFSMYWVFDKTGVSSLDRGRGHSGGVSLARSECQEDSGGSTSIMILQQGNDLPCIDLKRGSSTLTCVKFMEIIALTVFCLIKCAHSAP